MATQHTRVELFYQHTESGVTKFAWHPQLHSTIPDAAAVYARNAIGISHGRGAEQGEPTPSSATLTFAGHDHNPENPASDLYGLIGRNTPIRIISGDRPALVDTFTRTTVDGWTGAGALSWTLTGGAVPGDYDVTGGAGVVTHTSTNVGRYTTVDTGDADHRVRVVFDLAASDLTGAGATVWVLGRFTDTNNYYAARVLYDTSEVATLALYKRVGGTFTRIAEPVAIPETGPSGAGNDMLAELYVEGNRLYASCWRRFAGDEPLAWMISAEDDDLTTGTRGGMSSRRETGNTNTDLQFRFFDFAAVPGTIRFCGEVASWRPRRAKGGDRWVEVEAGDPLRRLQAPQTDALRSALWREILFGGPVAFWPVGDGVNASWAASALPGGPPMSIRAQLWQEGTPLTLDWSPVSYAAWLEPLATPAAEQVLIGHGAIDMDPAATEWAGDFVFAVDPDAAATSVIALIWEGNTGATRTDWIVEIFNDTWILMRRTVVDGTFVPGTDVIISGPDPLSYRDGGIHHMRFITVRDGSDVDWEIRFDNVTVGSGTAAGSAWSPLGGVTTQHGTPTGRTAMGFVAAWDTASPPFNAANAAVVGRAGELAGARFLRLCAEEGIAAEVIGETDGVDTKPMGPQLIDTLAANLAAIEAVDMGLLHGTRHQVGLTYRYRTSLYNQAPVVLDVDGGEVADPLEPDIGDLGVVNDVTVKRANGSSARSVQDDGPLNVNPPHLDPQGVGRYPTEVTVNAALDEQLPGLADWRRNRGTVKAVRYPQVTVLFGTLAEAGKTALARSVNRLRIGDRVDLDNAEPTGVMQLVPGYTETIGPTVAEREITLNGTPAQPYEIGVYDAASTRWDSRHSTTDTQITTGTDTSLSVAVEAGRALWSTTAAPFDIDLAGARVTVTAVAGAASPQTFTIDAAVVNGINKVIPAGTPVRLWSPKRYGL